MRAKIRKPFFLLAVALLCSCATPIKNATDFKEKVAVRISKETGVDTVWSQLAPPVVGKVYKRRMTAHGTYVLDENSSVFLKQIQPLVSDDPVQMSWNHEVSGTRSIKAQIDYLGLKTGLDARLVKTITFSAEGDTFTRIADWEGGVDKDDHPIPSFEEILNLTKYGPELRKRVSEDTSSIKDKRGVVKEERAKYWIVTSVVSVKNLGTSVRTTRRSDVVLGADAAKAFATFLNLSNLPEGSLVFGNDVTHNDSITIKGSYPIVAVAFPLLAETQSDGTIRMRKGEKTLVDSRK